MQKLFNKLNLSSKHLEVLNRVFSNHQNYGDSAQNDFQIYIENLHELNSTFEQLKIYDELYCKNNRQMILSDLFEYILLGRGFYVMKSHEEKEKFIKSILYLVNLLMCFESITVNTKLRKKVLKELSNEIPEINNEELFVNLINHNGSIGLPNSDASKQLNKYFDKFLPKTAGGLWHELLVYVFMLRNNLGFIIPLLLTQKIISKNENLIPPDFLLLTYDKRIYGIEVGTKKEIQSGFFSLKTAIPTATIDTINSRNSDRCPICKKWIQFCPFIIKNYSNFDFKIEKIEVKCIENCDQFSKEEIINGKCKYSKYSRGISKTLSHTKHDYSDNRHYHYKCVLNSVNDYMKSLIINVEDRIAIKTHYPYYAGLEVLNK